MTFAIARLVTRLPVLAAALSLASTAVAFPRILITNPGPRFQSLDIKEAATDKDSLFNNPYSVLQRSDTGGHIATVVTRADLSADGKAQKASVEVEVTDPFGYYNGADGQSPQSIVGAVAAKGFGDRFTLTKVGDRQVYRGAATLETRGDIGVAFRGQKGWNSREGVNYEAPVSVVRSP